MKHCCPYSGQLSQIWCPPLPHVPMINPHHLSPSQESNRKSLSGFSKTNLLWITTSQTLLLVCLKHLEQASSQNWTIFSSVHTLTQRWPDSHIVTPPQVHFIYAYWPMSRMIFANNRCEWGSKNQMGKVWHILIYFDS